MAPKKPQEKPETGKEFTLPEIRAANVARFQQLEANWEQVEPIHMIGRVGELLAQVPTAIEVVESGGAANPLVVHEKFVDAYLALDLAAHLAGINLNEAIPEHFNQVSQRMGSDVELEYVGEANGKEK